MIFVFRVTEIVNRDVKPQIKITHVYVVTSWFYSCILMHIHDILYMFVCLNSMVFRDSPRGPNNYNVTN